jgi:serine/threonine protein kinase
VWKITDFGFTAEGSSKRIVISSMGRGTQSYRALELVQEQPVYTRKVDIWAVGCILYELVSGKKAFHDDWQVREYGLERKKLSVPEIDYHYRSSRQFFSVMMRETLHKDWLKRPSAQQILRYLDDFDLHLMDRNHKLRVELVPGDNTSTRIAVAPNRVTVAPVPRNPGPIPTTRSGRTPKCHRCRRNKKKVPFLYRVVC